MDVERRFVEREQLTDVVRAAFGAVRRLTLVNRLRGGSKKGVYRLTLDDGYTAILYVWDPAENYWPARPAGSTLEDPFADASGIELFETSRAHLDTAGVRTPRVYLADATRAAYPADIAVVEDVRGGTLQALIARDPRGAEEALARLGADLEAMRRSRRPRFGKVRVVAGATAGAAEHTCEGVVLDRALADLDEAASRVDRIAAAHAGLESAARGYAAEIRPRAEYGLIHGELGPDHVLLDERGRPVLIDIEGAMFFDVEWEHAFLRLRFGPHYRWLRADGLDEERLRFYALAQHLSLVAGPLRLLDGDFPDRAEMRRIAEVNADLALSFVP